MGEQVFVSDLLDLLNYATLEAISNTSVNLRARVENIFKTRLLQESGADKPAPWFQNDPQRWLKSYNWSKFTLSAGIHYDEFPDFRWMKRKFGYIQQVTYVRKTQGLCLFSNSELYLTQRSNDRFRSSGLFYVETGVNQVSERNFLKDGKVYEISISKTGPARDFKVNPDLIRVSEYPIVQIGKHYWVDQQNRCKILYEHPEDVDKRVPHKNFKWRFKAVLSPSDWIILPEPIQSVAYHQKQEHQIALIQCPTQLYFVDLLNQQIINLQDLVTNPGQNWRKEVISSVVQILSTDKPIFPILTAAKELYLLSFTYNNGWSVEVIWALSPFQGQINRLFHDNFQVGLQSYGYSYIHPDNTFSNYPKAFGEIYLDDVNHNQPTVGHFYSTFDQLQDLLQRGKLSLSDFEIGRPDIFGNVTLSYWPQPSSQNKSPIICRVFQHPETGQFYEYNNIISGGDPNEKGNEKSIEITDPDGNKYRYVMKFVEKHYGEYPRPRKTRYYTRTEWVLLN